MKNYLRAAIIFTGLSVMSADIHAQLNPLTNTFSQNNDPAVSLPAQYTNVPDLNQATGITCHPNTFWATWLATGIDEFNLNGNVISFNSIITNSTYYASLAYCNNLDNGAFSPTFYDCHDTTVGFFNGATWSSGSSFPSHTLINCGASGDFLYYITLTQGPPRSITRYMNGSFNTIFTLQDSTRYFTVADLAVDDSGNVWFFTGPVLPTNLITDTLNVISPSGQMLKQFPFNYDTENAYGSFLLNGTLYFGLGPSNTIHPNTMVPITISTAAAVAGTPIVMPFVVNYNDLASCNAGTPLAVKENSIAQNFNLFPDPALDVLTVTSPAASKKEFSMSNINGSLLQTILSFDTKTVIDIQLLAAGIYFIECKSSEGIFRKKFIKQ